jgi:hypothetical protein
MTRRYIARLCAGTPASHLNAQVAELVDALVSGASEAIRGGSSPLLGTNLSLLFLCAKETKEKDCPFRSDTSDSCHEYRETTKRRDFWLFPK